MNADTPMFLAGLMLMTACDGDLPDRYRVIERRVVAARLAVEGDDSRAEVLPEEVLTVEPLLVDPSGRIPPASVDGLWLACALAPGQAPFACMQQAMPIAPGDIPRCPTPEPEPSWIDPAPFPSPCVMPRQRDGTAALGVPPTPTLLESGALELTFIAGTAGGTSTERCAEELLAGEYDVPADCLYGVHVAPIGPPHVLGELAAKRGLELPQAPTPPEGADGADRNPRITRFSAVVRSSEDSRAEPVAIERGDILEVRRGDTLELEVTSPPEDLQPYGVPADGGSSLDVATEAYEGRWFITWGELQSDVSLDPESTNEWTIDAADDDDDDGPTDGLAHLTYVVRDGRSGVAWSWFSVRVAG